MAVREERVVDDNEIRARIEQLVTEEHQLWDAEAGGEVTESDRSRLDSIKVTLDQCWDLLRQRRALREFGLDPDVAATRDEDTVEHYEQ
jgi:hypothetical protein